jgi:prevent-host-death family protein
MEITTVSIAQAKRNFSRLVQLTSDREREVVITKRGKPVAVIIPFEEHQKSKRFEGYLKVMAARDRFVGKGVYSFDVYRKSRAELEERPCGNPRYLQASAR